jgi:adenosylmethionine-8-amino-7-oxononanoate aminotransferase
LRSVRRVGDDLLAHAPDGISHVYFVSGGSEAIEASLKLARQYFVEIGEPQRRHFIARRQSYHGNTLGALAVGGNAWRREKFAPLLIETHHVSPTFEYREKRPGETPEEYGARLAQELEAKIEELGDKSVIGFVAETVGGATSGCITPPPGYFRRVREICDRHGVLLILDEVMCGMGRTGTLHACEQEGVARPISWRSRRRSAAASRRSARCSSGAGSSKRWRKARASSCTVTPISATRSPARPRSPCRG